MYIPNSVSQPRGLYFWFLFRKICSLTFSGLSEFLFDEQTNPAVLKALSESRELAQYLKISPLIFNSSSFKHMLSSILSTSMFAISSEFLACYAMSAQENTLSLNLGSSKVLIERIDTSFTVSKDTKILLKCAIPSCAYILYKHMSRNSIFKLKFCQQFISSNTVLKYKLPIAMCEKYTKQIQNFYDKKLSLCLKHCHEQRHEHYLC
ncbi:hypothetical protein AGLY_015514 [Aphis glycines]|uniref:Uncharacterized protein n=1 Tax=Aphis glycines TaxID=307491 RepID=A0A6G0T0P9_APHGL|nr:hypothetical protein AGLY_015514 [Aphis glycines]